MIRIIAAAMAGASVLTGAALAQRAPVAIVEDVNSKTAGVEFMDYVVAGKTIKLGAQDSLVLSYMKSCVRETIVGGTVVVGNEMSAVNGGTVQRDKVPCDGGKIQLVAQQQSQSAGAVFRDMPRARDSDPQLTIYGVSPVFEVRTGGTLTIERTDRRGERIEVQIDAKDLLRGKFYDTLALDQTLTPSGIYVARLDGQQVVFKVDPKAQTGQMPVIGRLVRFPAKS
jgi:hypothetical protein